MPTCKSCCAFGQKKTKKTKNIQLTSNTSPQATKINTHTLLRAGTCVLMHSELVWDHSRPAVKEIPQSKQSLVQEFLPSFSLTEPLRAAKAIPLMSSMSVKRRDGVCFQNYSVITAAILHLNHENKRDFKKNKLKWTNACFYDSSDTWSESCLFLCVFQRLNSSNNNCIFEWW